LVFCTCAVRGTKEDKALTSEYVTCAFHAQRRFMAVAEQHPQTHPAAFKASLNQALEDLPTHCLRYGE